MKTARKVRLVVEQFECRIVPSTVAAPATPPAPYKLWAVSNWSGIDLDTKNDAVTAVSASWGVPAVSSTDTGTGYSSAWVGIDGDLSSTVEQIGTESDTATTSKHDGTPQYYAWFEMYPGPSVTITKTNSGSAFKVAPGDTISASVTYVDTTISGRHTYENFMLTITDTPASGAATETYSTTQSISGAEMSSAEWIQEAPSGSSVLPLSNFGSITFSNASATISGVSGTISSFVGNSSVVNYGTTANPLEINLMDIGTQNRAGQWTSIGDETSLLTGGNSFTIQFGSSSTGPGGIAMYGPVDRTTGTAESQDSSFNSAAPAGSEANLLVVEISFATPSTVGTLNPPSMNETVAPLGHHQLFIQPEGEGIVGHPAAFGVSLIVGEGRSEGDLSLFGLPSVSENGIPLGITPFDGDALGEGMRSFLGADPFETAWPLFELPSFELPSTPAFSEDAPIDRLFGALALVAVLSNLQMPPSKEEPARVRRLLNAPSRRERTA